MSLTRILSSKNKNPQDKYFRDSIKSIAPKSQFFTKSDKIAFKDYQLVVPRKYDSTYLSGLVGTAFDYLARFMVGRYLKKEAAIHNLVAYQGLKKVDYDEKYTIVENWMEQLTEYINGEIINYDEVIIISVRLAKLENICRTFFADNSPEYIFLEDVSEGIIEDLLNLANLFEKNFIQSDAINEKSNVVFNPHFGVGSDLVNGADADLFVDGVLFDFKTTDKFGYNGKDAQQLIGYYFLNEIALLTDSDQLGFNYERMEIKNIAFYKARAGEFEYFNIKTSFNDGHIRSIVKDIVTDLKRNDGNLYRSVQADVTGAIEKLEEIRM